MERSYCFPTTAAALLVAALAGCTHQCKEGEGEPQHLDPYCLFTWIDQRELLYLSEGGRWVLCYNDRPTANFGQEGELRVLSRTGLASPLAIGRATIVIHEVRAALGDIPPIYYEESEPLFVITEAQKELRAFPNRWELNIGGNGTIAVFNRIGAVEWAASDAREYAEELGWAVLTLYKYRVAN